MSHIKKIVLSVLAMAFVAVTAFNVQAAEYPDGWNQVNGRQYYYENGELKSKTGVDVSAYQPNINWDAAKDDGIQFAIIRIGFGDDLERQDDKWADYNMDECERIGMPYGVYIYSYATSDDHTQSEIAHTVRMLQGRNPEIGVWFDSEENSCLERAGADALNRFADTYMETIRNEYGYRTGLYASKYWLTSILTSDSLRMYNIWVAQYSNNLTYDGDYKIWQYASDGSVDGIPGRVDMDAMLADSSDNTRMDYVEDIARQDAENYVRTDYMEYLHREADQSGLEAYTNKLMATGDFTGIDESLRSSAEYKERVAAVITDGLYNGILGRDADPDGENAVTSYLMCQNLDSITELYINMEDSEEYRNAKKEEFIENCYRFYLHRETSTEEINDWMQQNLLRDISYGIYYSQEAINKRE